MVKKLSEVYLETRRRLAFNNDTQESGKIARSLLCQATGMSQEKLIASMDTDASEAVCDRISDAVSRVQFGEPLAYVLGEWEFYGLRLFVDKNVLIPRDDTCAVTDLAIKKALFLEQNPRILDLCTGSGCIGLAIANRLKDARVTLADISREALAVAKKNIAENKLSGHVSCVVADAMAAPSPFLGKFDMIVSNPPYITTEEMVALPTSVKNYEPHLALHGGTDGLDFYRSIAKNYVQALKPGGYLCFEFGMGQGDAVCAILETNGYTILERTRDYNNRERAVIAQYGRKDNDYGYEKDNL